MKLFPIPKNPYSDYPERKWTILSRGFAVAGGIFSVIASDLKFSKMSGSESGRGFLRAVAWAGTIAAFSAVSLEFHERYGGGGDGGGGPDLSPDYPSVGPTFGKDQDLIAEIEVYLASQQLDSV